MRYFNRQNAFWQKQKEKEEATRVDLGVMVAAFAKPTAVDQLLGNDGPLAESLPGYQMRPAQLQMARVVESSIRTKQTSIVEAGTGSGKSYAYLIPIIASAKMAVVAPGTIALMDQLMADLAFLKKHLGIPFSYAKQMGIGNYACREKWPERKLGFDEEFDEVEEWLEETKTGDLSELSFPAKKSSYWELTSTFTTNSESCSGRKCEAFADCYYYQARNKAAARASEDHAHIIVTNHALVAHDLAAGRQLLPPHEVLVLDECHGFESVVRDSLQNSATRKRLRKTLSELRSNVTRCRANIEEVRKAEEPFWMALDEHLAELDGIDRLVRTELPPELLLSANKLVEPLADLEFAAQAEAESMPQGGGRILKYCRSLKELRLALASLATEVSNCVTWAEKKDGGPVKLHSTSVRVGAWLRAMLFSAGESKPDSVILTSATIATSSDDVRKFEHLKEALGIEAALELRVPSPFDYRRQMLYYVPPRLQDPRRQRGERGPAATERYCRSIAPVIQQTLQATRGRAFVLFTSYANMELCRRLVDCDYPVKCQGELDNKKLVEWFKATPHSVLFGTSSFWEGVDVPGD